MESAERVPWAALLPAETSENYKKYDWLVPQGINTRNEFWRCKRLCWRQVGGGLWWIRAWGVSRCAQNPHCSNLQTAFLKDMAAAGFPPETIDTVLCTHPAFGSRRLDARAEMGAGVYTFPEGESVWPNRSSKPDDVMLHTTGSSVLLVAGSPSSISGKRSSLHFVSCKQTTSYCFSPSHDSKRSRRLRRELMFQLASS